MKYIFSFLTLVVLFSGCSREPAYVDYFPYHDNGAPKPRVAFGSVTPIQVDAKEAACFFEDEIRWHAMDHAELFFYTKEESQRIKDAFEKGSKEGFCLDVDFLVVAELLQDELVPYNKNLVNCFIPNAKPRCSNARVLKLRLTITDLRYTPSKVVLFEVLEKSQLVPTCDERPFVAKSVYERLAEEACYRIEEVICSAR